jgi:Putative outer membrane beta-barrel porin, MtrB/PioB
MKRTFLAFAALALAASANAQEDFQNVSVTLGALQKDFDTNSSKFLEYRDIPQGMVLPALRFQGKKGSFRYDLQGRDVTQGDQQYLLKVEDDRFRLKGAYIGVPHNFGNGGKSLLAPVLENEWRVADTTQAGYQNAIIASGNNTSYSFLSALVQPGLNAAPADIDLKLQRNRGSLALDFTPGEGHLDFGVTYLHERRSGTRSANGTSFGFNNVIETPEPLRYITQDFGVNAAYRGDWGSARAGINFNDFRNTFDDFIFDNPFRITPATDNPVFGRTSLPPDNKATTESVGGTFKIGSKTRLTADIAFGQWRQNEDAFIPFTTNTAIVTTSGQPAVTFPLPADRLDGKIDTTSLNGFVTTRLGEIGLNARYRHYGSDNTTPRYQLAEGYARFDATWNGTPRITVPYGYTNDFFDVYGTYGKGLLGLEVGWKINGLERTFRETEKTTENVFRAAVDVRGDSVLFRGIGEFGSRDHEAYHAAEAEHQSFLPVPGEVALPANQTVLRRYDQAKRDLTRVGATLEFSPGSGKAALFASFFHTNIDYDQDPVPCEDVELFSGQSQFCPGGVQAPLGMVHDTYDTFTLEASFAPGERWNAYAFYSYEDGDILQNGRQSGSTLNFATADVWTSNIVNRGDSFGAGLDFTLVPDKWFLGLVGRYQKVDGNNDVTLLPGFSTSIYSTSSYSQCVGTPGPCAIPAFDDTKFSTVLGTLRYQFAKRWSAGAGLGFEDYQLDDSQTGNTLNYMPSSFFLQANNRDYKAWVGYLNLTYTNQ